jgi:glycosyltransferase involved in cell wall biosynthesis
MPAGPLVSVVVPAYNAGETIGNAIQSVLSQTTSDLELIVVDDASTDHTLQQVVAVGDPRLRVLQLERNSGCAAARNRGVENARGRWVAFLDADDEWVPDRLERLLQVTGKSPGFVADWLAPCRAGSDGRLTPLKLPNLPVQSSVEQYGLTEYLAWRGCAFPIVSRTVLIDTGVEFPEWGSGNEWMFWMARLSACGIEGKLLHRVGYLYRVTGPHRGLTLRSIQEEVDVAEFLAVDPDVPEKAKQIIKERIPGIRRQLELAALLQGRVATFARHVRGSPVDLAWLPVSLVLFLWRRVRYGATALSVRPA